MQDRFFSRYLVRLERGKSRMKGDMKAMYRFVVREYDRLDAVLHTESGRVRDKSGTLRIDERWRSAMTRHSQWARMRTFLEDRLVTCSDS
jgi:hypothetical protein